MDLAPLADWTDQLLAATRVLVFTALELDFAGRVELPPNVRFVGPAFEPDSCLAFPQAQIAVMGPEAAINAVFFNQIQEIEEPEERERFVREKREQYSEDIDILHLASELVVDAVIEPDQLRAELVRRYALAATKDRSFAARRNPVTPA